MDLKDRLGYIERFCLKGRMKERREEEEGRGGGGKRRKGTGEEGREGRREKRGIE